MRPETEDQRRWHTCLRKVAFNSIEAAYTFVRKNGHGRRRNERTLDAYQCIYCGKWHLATRKVNRV